MMGDIKTGTYTGTGAAITLELGFIPDYFRVFNVTDGTAGWTWFRGMAAGTALAEATLATLASGGVTTNAGTRGGTKAGLTLGTALSVSGKVHYYVAIREHD